MIALRTLLLGALAATLLAIGPAHATPPCSHWKDGNALTVHGTITRTGPALKIVADHPLCGLGSLLNLDPNADGKMLDEKWLGMRVKIEGTPEEVGDNGTVLFTIKSIKDDGAADETYNYNCDLGKGRTSHLLVNATKNVLTWRGKKYAITVQPECAKYGWHAAGNGTAFDFCTATQGAASIDQPGQDGVPCDQYLSERR
jgi:hypothetical protein